MKVTPPQINVSWLINYLTQKGVPAESILTAAGLSAQVRLVTLKRLPLLSYLKLLNHAAEILADDNLGLNLAKTFQAEDFGYVGLAVHHCTTVRDALRAAHQFHALFSQGIDMIFDESPTTSSFIYRHLLPTGEALRHDVEHTTILIVLSLRATLGDGWRPLRIDFIHPQPTDISQHIEEFGDSVCFFNQPSNRITFNSDCLDARLSDADPELQQHLRTQIEQMLSDAQREDDLLAKVRYYTALSHSSPRCGADLIAELVHMSRRSLTRHLTDLGASFRGIKEDVTLEPAKTALLKSHANINAIALELGFSDSTAFSRSFKNSTGITPTEYRQQVRE